ncbi:MAG: hypothetical protein ACRC46_07180 [Thermoguttaceae bacterium]
MALFKKKPKDAADSKPAPVPKAASAPTPAKPKVDVRPDLYTLILGLSVLFILVGFLMLLLNDLIYQKEGSNVTSGVSWNVTAPAESWNVSTPAESRNSRGQV